LTSLLLSLTSDNGLSHSIEILVLFSVGVANHF
jgi:hypothetical protein